MALHLKQFTGTPNAGDAASAVILSKLSGDAVEVIGEAPFGRTNVIAIGSIMHWADACSVIWGAGFISETVPLPAVPKAIVAVRGPLTYGRLKRQGIACAPVLGDPGILISDIYPGSEKTTRIGVVPHYVDAADDFVLRAREAGAQVLDVTAPLDEFISQLSGCRSIISSSLHGLIFAHAYGIPAAWVKVSDKVFGDGFKFRDYYGSVGVAPRDIPLFGRDDSLTMIEGHCGLPRDPIDRAALAQALRDALPILREGYVPRTFGHRWSGRGFAGATSDQGDRMAERLAGSGLFNAEDSLTENPHLRSAGVDARRHDETGGLLEHRWEISQERVEKLLAEVDADYAREAAAFLDAFRFAQTESARHAGLASRFLIAIYVHSNANYTVHSIASALANALQSAGARSIVLTERDPQPSVPTLPIVVAPHEFFTMDLTSGFREPGFLNRCVLFNTGQLQSDQTFPALPWLYGARAILDLGFHNSIVWRHNQIPAIHLLPPVDAAYRRRLLADLDCTHPLLAWMPPEILDLAGAIDRIQDRPLDVFFAGYATEAPTSYFLRNAKYLAGKQCFLADERIPKTTVPLDAFTRKLLAANIAASLLAKVSLNLNGFALGSLQWERTLVTGFCCGTPVVTTPSLRSPFFTPGEHYFEVADDELDTFIPWLLDSAEGMAEAERVARRGRDVVETELTPARTGRFLLSFLADLEAGAMGIS